MFETSQYIPGISFMTDKQIKQSLNKLKRFDDYEEYLKKKAEAKNNLESFIYKSREYLDDSEFISFARQDELNYLQALTTDVLI